MVVCHRVLASLVIAPYEDVSLCYSYERLIKVIWATLRMANLLAKILSALPDLALR